MIRNIITAQAPIGKLTCEAFPRARGRYEVICSLVKPTGEITFASHGTWPDKETALSVAKDVQKLWKRNPYAYYVIDKRGRKKLVITKNPIRYVDGWQWGRHGKIYKSRKKAVRQMRAAYWSGYRSNPTTKSLLSLAGLYLIIDGIASLYVFRDQQFFPNQAVRVGRTVIGLWLLGKAR